MKLGRLTAAIALLVLSLGGEAAAADYFRNRTALIVSPTTGTSVIHFVRRGRAYLWAPGSAEFIEGRWSTLPDGAMPKRACFHFGRDRYNPLTGASGAQTNCVSWVEFSMAMIVEQVDGDVFGMTSCRVAPFVLNQGRTSLSALARQAGVRLTTEVIRTDDWVARPGGGGPSAKELALIDELIRNPGSGRSRPVAPDLSGLVPPPCPSPR